MAYLLLRYLFPAFIGTLSANTDPKRGAVEASGPPVATTRTGGIIGRVQMTTPLLGVSVYTAGLVVKPIFMPSIVVLASEIRRVSSNRRFFTWRLEIEHAAPDSLSPLVLYLKPDSAVAEAIRAITAPSPAPAGPGPSTAPPGSPLPQRLVFLTGISNLVFGTVGITYAAFGMGATPEGFRLVWTLMAVVFIVNGTRLLLRSRRDPLA